MNLHEKEVFLRLTLMWMMQGHFFLRMNIQSHSWCKEACETYQNICLGEVYDALSEDLEGFFLGENEGRYDGYGGRAAKISLHNARIWMLLYRQWCDKRLSTTRENSALLADLDESVARRYISSRGWSLEVGRRCIDLDGWWGREWNTSQANIPVVGTNLALTITREACVLSDATWSQLRDDHIYLNTSF